MVDHFPLSEPITSRRAAVAPAGVRRIAIADDEPAMRIVLTRVLRGEGYEVREACDGADLLALAEAFDPDTIVTDFRMPRMTGLDALRALRERASRVRVILVTASPLAEVREAAHSLGAIVLAKPFDLPELLAAIRS